MCILYILFLRQMSSCTPYSIILDELNDRNLLTHRLKTESQFKVSESIHSENYARKSLWSERIPRSGGLLEVVDIPWLMLGHDSSVSVHIHTYYPQVCLSQFPLFMKTPILFD